MLRPSASRRRGATAPLDLVAAVADYVGRLPRFRNFSFLDDASWAKRVESAEEWLYGGGIAAIFTPEEDILIRTGYEDSAVHELLHAAGFMPRGVSDFINEGFTQVVAEEICASLGIEVRRSYGDETRFVRRYLLSLLPQDLRSLARAYAAVADKGKMLTDLLWDQYGSYFADTEDWGQNVETHFKRDMPTYISGGSDDYLHYLVDELGLSSMNERQQRSATTRIAKWERYDLMAEAEAMNNTAFGGALVLDFPLVYRPMRHRYGVARAKLWPNGNIVVTEVAISSLYDMSRELFSGILGHELIHVALFQRGISKDVGDAHHGAYFRAEMNKLAARGLKIPLSEDVPAELAMDPGKPFRDPIWVAVIDHSTCLPFRRIMDQATYDRLIRALKYNARATGKASVLLELYQTSNPEVRRFPIAHDLGSALNKHTWYKISPSLYQTLQPDLASTVEL